MVCVVNEKKLESLVCALVVAVPTGVAGGVVAVVATTRVARGLEYLCMCSGYYGSSHSLRGFIMGDHELGKSSSDHELGESSSTAVHGRS